jgi:hypothetical protein
MTRRRITSPSTAPSTNLVTKESEPSRSLESSEPGAEHRIRAQLGGQLLERDAAQQPQVETGEHGDRGGGGDDPVESVVVDHLPAPERHARSMRVVRRWRPWHRSTSSSASTSVGPA